MKTIEESIDLTNQKIYSLLQENPVENLESIKELTRIIQRLSRSRMVG
jgi:hypothetical protein